MASASTSFDVDRDPAEDAKIRAACAFHLAIPVRDIEEARAFYGPDGVLGLREGRSTATWIDFNFYGHQLVTHLVRGYDAKTSHNAVNGDPVPVPHFGLAMDAESFRALVARCEERGASFEIGAASAVRRGAGRAAWRVSSGIRRGTRWSSRR